MLKKRIIPVTLFSNGWLVQTKNFSNFRNLGNPYEIIKRLSKFGSDELIYVDKELLKPSKMWLKVWVLVN